MEILPLGEGTDLDDNGRFYKFKRARFRVNGQEHTIRISMKDFNENRTRQIIDSEVAKIVAGTGKDKPNPPRK